MRNILGWRRFLITLGVLVLAWYSVYTGRDIGGNTLTMVCTLVPLYLAASTTKTWLDNRAGKSGRP